MMLIDHLVVASRFRLCKIDLPGIEVLADGQCQDVIGVDVSTHVYLGTRGMGSYGRAMGGLAHQPPIKNVHDRFPVARTDSFPSPVK
jgi:hypothetical protein